MKNTDPEDLDSKWFDSTIKYVKKLTANGGNWSSLSEQEQELASLWKLEADMYNGGFMQFFCNWGYECYLHVVRCLTKLDANYSLDLIQQQYHIIQCLEDDNRLKQLWDIPKFLTEEEIKKIDDLDAEYWKNSDNIVEKTFEVYKDYMI